MEFDAHISGLVALLPLAVSRARDALVPLTTVRFTPPESRNAKINRDGVESIMKCTAAGRRCC